MFTDGDAHLEIVDIPFLELRSSYMNHPSRAGFSQIGDEAMAENSSLASFAAFGGVEMARIIRFIPTFPSNRPRLQMSAVGNPS